jgi:hypothetical protein
MDGEKRNRCYKGLQESVAQRKSKGTKKKGNSTAERSEGNAALQ